MKNQFICKTISFQVPDNVKVRMDTLSRNGFEAWIVGGASLHHVAGEHLGIRKHKGKPKDYDVFTNATSEQLFELFDDITPIGGQERLERIFTVVTNDGIEMSTYRQGGKRESVGKTIVDHLSTCDYTINAIATNGDIAILPEDVLSHIRTGTLVAMGNPQDRIDEDFNRVMRAFRFTGKYELYIEDELYLVLQNTDISQVPAENIRDEFFKLLPYPHGLQAFILSGKFFELFPEMEAMKGLNGRGIWHEEDVFDHSYEVYTQMLKLTKDPLLLFIALFHDYGKPKAFIPDTKKFTGHDEIGYEEIKPLLKRLKLTNRDQKKVLWLIRSHMWGKESTTEKKKKWFKFFNGMEDSGVRFIEFISLMYADTTGRKSNGEWVYTSFDGFTDYIMSSNILSWYSLYMSGAYPKRVKNLMLHGDELIELGVHEGPKVGEILEKLYDMVLADELPNDHEVLLKQVKKWMKK